MLNKFSWAILCPATAVLAIQPQLDLAAFVSLLLCFYAVYTQGKVIHFVATCDELKRLLGNEWITLIIGSLVVIWVSLQQVCQIVQSWL